jgi:hypothetical protein
MLVCSCSWREWGCLALEECLSSAIVGRSFAADASVTLLATLPVVILYAKAGAGPLRTLTRTGVTAMGVARRSAVREDCGVHCR